MGFFVHQALYSLLKSSARHSTFPINLLTRCALVRSICSYQRDVTIYCGNANLFKSRLSCRHILLAIRQKNLHSAVVPPSFNQRTSNNIQCYSILRHGLCGRTIFGWHSFRLPHARTISQRVAEASKRNHTVVLYVLAVTVLIGGLSYAAVPLYAVFCQTTGLGGQAVKGHDTEKVETMIPIRSRQVLIKFNADTAASMRWNFRPQQPEIKVYPGETALAFYSALNPTDKPIIGISTYNVVPFEAGQYFNKIQCFCFEEQRLNPHEQVDMPVFFYIDPEFAEDPKMVRVDTITLSYTFFEAKEGLKLPDPWTKH